MDDSTSYKAAYPRWSIWDVLLVLAALLILVPASALLKQPAVKFFQNTAPARVHSLLLLTGTAVQAGVMIGAVILLIRRKGARIKELGLNWVHPAAHVLTGFWSGILLCFGVIGLGMLISMVTGPPPPQEVEKLLQSFKAGREIWLPFVAISVLAPISEEIYFRGMAYPVFKARFGKIPAMIISALFFASMHMDIYRLLPICLGGIGLAYLYEKTGSLITSIIAHSTWNTLMLTLLYTASQISAGGR